MSKRLRAIIADDEPLARQALRRFLNAEPDVDIVAEAEDVPSLKSLLKSHTPDLLLLDITMPGGRGLDVLPFLDGATSVVFTTAHAEHAAAAFDVDAVDYLVKPFGGDRVRDALARVRRRRAAAQSHAATQLKVLIVRIGQVLYPVPVESIWRFEGCDDFVRVVTAEKQWLHGVTLQAIATQLDPATFLRVHRSHVINLTKIARIVQSDERRLAVQFEDGSRVVCSRAGSSALRQHARVVDR
jgi:two-component system, LytTR family, response regulator